NDQSFPKSSLRLNQFGGTFGGPIIKNQTFYFLNYEGFRRRAGITRITNVPTLAERAGNFTDQNGNPVTFAVNPVSAQLFNLFPKPNLNDPSGNFISSPEQTDGTDQFLVKVDHRLRESDNLSARYSRTRIDTFFPFTPGQSGTNVPGYGVNDNGANHLVAINYTRVLSPRTARHSLKAGVDIRYTQLNRLYDLAFSGQVSFSGTSGQDALVNFAQGLSSGALQFVGDSHRNFRNTSFGFFGQDSFKLRRNLTLNYGLRYELNTVLNEAHGRLSSFRPQNFTTFLD